MVLHIRLWIEESQGPIFRGGAVQLNYLTLWISILAPPGGRYRSAFGLFQRPRSGPSRSSTSAPRSAVLSRNPALRGPESHPRGGYKPRVTVWNRSADPFFSLRIFGSSTSGSLIRNLFSHPRGDCYTPPGLALSGKVSFTLFLPDIRIFNL